jgi:NTP pyrophosphatase (non-canonical NTP hydrolase)
MYFINLIIAAFLITGEPNTPIAYKSSLELRQALSQLSLDLELMDPREQAWEFVSDDSFESDVNIIRNRWVDLQDAPFISDAQMFPDREVLNKLLSFNRDFRSQMSLRQDAVWIFKAEEIQEIIEETDKLYYLIDNMLDVKDDCYYLSYRRAALKTLKEELGDEAYYAGAVPPHVPIWRFQKR